MDTTLDIQRQSLSNEIRRCACLTTSIKHHFETGVRMQRVWTHQKNVYFLANIFKLFSVFIGNPAYRGLSEICLFVKIGHFLFFRFRCLIFFYPNFTWSTAKTERKGFEDDYNGSSERIQWKGRLLYFFASQV